MYNAEKFVAECLESILIQTFPNFEVIVVNDCSTDSSCKIIERYIPKFGGRLHLSHMEKNSGSAPAPRNKGLIFSRGEYVFFMDADDLFLPTALAELYTLAKNFDADVVYCEKYYQTDGDNIEIDCRKEGVTVNKPTLETEDLAERLQKILNGRYWVTPWCKLVRRNLLIEHEINFPHCAISEDDIWTFGLVFYAKKFLRVPNITYIRRYHDNSVTKRKRTPQQTINFWTSPVILGLKTLDGFMSKLEFFKNNPQHHYAVLENFILGRINFIADWNLPSAEIYKTIKNEFGQKLGEQDVLISALCTFINTQQKIFHVSRQNFDEFVAQARKRIAQLESELNRKT